MDAEAYYIGQVLKRNEKKKKKEKEEKRQQQYQGDKADIGTLSLKLISSLFSVNAFLFSILCFLVIVLATVISKNTII